MVAKGIFFSNEIICFLGEEKFTQSDTILVEVSGKPQFVSNGIDSSTWFPRASEAILKVSYCSDPPPLRTEWLWNNLVLTQGKTKNEISIIHNF